MAKAVKYLEGLTIHKVPYNIANTSDFKTNVMGKAADNELFIITDTPTFSLKIGNVTYDGTSNVSADTATQSVSGLMSAADKKKLDGIATGATKITVDTALSNTSTNPVQNKVIYSALSGKAGTSVATTNTNGLMSAADKKKLDGIAKGANKTIVDTTLSDTSTNPVQNKVIKTELDKKADNTALDAKADKTALDGKLNKTGGTLTGAITTKGIKLKSGTDFGSSLPSSLQSNQLFFQTLGSNYILDNVYPVGSIYMSVNSTNPENLFGGTWEQIQGKFLFGMNSSYPAGSTGGEITHKLTIDEMPEHGHTIYFPNAGGPSGNANIGYPANSGIKLTWYAEMCKTAFTGGGAVHNNMPPYLSVYIWKRTK